MDPTCLGWRVGGPAGTVIDFMYASILAPSAWKILEQLSVRGIRLVTD